MNQDTELHYAVEYIGQYSDGQEIFIHVSDRLTEAGSTSNGIPHIDTYDLDYRDDPDEPTAEPLLLRDLRTIEGVVCVERHPYSIHLVKSPLFDWDEILELALNYIALHISEDRPMIEHPTVDRDDPRDSAPAYEKGERPSAAQRFLSQISSFLKRFSRQPTERS